MDPIILDLENNGWNQKNVLIHFDPLKFEILIHPYPLDKNPSNPFINNFFLDGYSYIHPPK